MACNDHLITVLERMHDSQEAQDQWVRKDSGFDDDSKKMMTRLVAGERACVDEFLGWIRDLQYELPVSLVAEQDAHDSWQMTWDGVRTDEMSDLDYDMIDAMRYIAFNSRKYREDNPIVERMLGMGLPEQLRQNVADA